MKSARRPLALLLIAAASLTTGVADPIVYFWDPNGAAGGLGGSGNWDTVTANWTVDDQAPEASFAHTFTDADAALFLGTPGVVTLTTAITINGINFETPGYTLTGSGVLNLRGLSPFVATGRDVVINNAINIDTVTEIANDSDPSSLEILHLRGQISGAGSLIKSTEGTIAMGHAGFAGNTFTGGLTTPGGGLLTLEGNGNGASVVGTGALTVGAGSTVRALSDHVLGRADGGALSALIITGGVFEAAASTHINAITMTGGTLGVSPGVSQVNGMDLRTRGATAPTLTILAAPDTATISSKLTLTDATTVLLADGANAVDLRITGAIGGGSLLTIGGAGTLELTGANTYTGGTVVTGGTLAITGSVAGGVSIGDGATLALSGGAALADNAALVSAGSGRLVLNDSETLGSLAGAGAVELGAHTLTLGGDNASTAYAGVISGTGGLVKTGTGTLTLSGANDYTGVTRIAGSTLAVSILTDGGVASGLGAASADAANLVLENNARLRYTGTGGSTDRRFTLGGADGFVVTLENAGTGALTFTDPGALAFITPDRAGLLALDGANADANTLAAALTDNGAGVLDLEKRGDGTWILAGANTYSGLTIVTRGTLALAGGAAIADSGVVNLTSAATVRLDASEAIGSLAGKGRVELGAHTLTLGGTGSSGAYFGVISGAGQLVKAGAGTLTLTGANTHTGGTVINAGTLTLSGGNALADTGSVQILAGATLALGAAETIGALTGPGTVALGANRLTVGGGNASSAYAGVIAGPGGLTKTGTGTLTLSGANTYAGATAVNAGTLTLTGGAALADSAAVSVASGAVLRISASETLGGLAGAGSVIVDSATTLTVAGAADTTFTGTVTGFGALTKTGSGDLTLSGLNTYSGDTTVAGTGALIVDGSLASATTRVNGGTLTGGGAITGNVIVNSGALEGASGRTLVVANGVTLSASSALVARLGAPSDNALFTLTGGTLTLDGTLEVDDALGFGAGVYRLFDYTGTLVNNGLNVGATPENNPSAFTIDVSTAGQVNLVYAGTGSYWDGNTAGDRNDNQVDGGSGTWKLVAGADDWTDSNGAANVGWSPGRAVFRGAPGVVTVDNTDGQVSVTGMRFEVDGYRIQGDSVLLVLGESKIQVGDAASGAGFTATIGSELLGPGGLVKTGLGKLVLTAANTYDGATRVTRGTLVLSGEGSLSSGAVTVDPLATLQFDLADDATLANDLSGPGEILKSGAGVTTLTGDNTAFSGDFEVTGGTLSQGAENAFGTGASFNVGNATLDLGASDVTANGVTLASGTITGTGGKLAFVDLLALSGTVSANLAGAGALFKSDAATVTLSGDNTAFTGKVLLGVGTLQLDSANALAAASVEYLGGTLRFATDATLAAANADRVNQVIRLEVAPGVTGTVSGVLQGDGATLTLTGAGTLVLAGANTYDGATRIAAGATLAVSTLANGGVASNLGAAAADAGNLILEHNATLRYTGAGSSTNRLFQIGGVDGATATLAADGAGALAFTNPGAIGFVTPNLGATLVLSGTNTGDNTLAASLSDNGSGAVALRKSQSGHWILSGANTHTGPTDVMEGVLTLAGGSALADTGAVTVGASAQLRLAASETLGSLAGAGTVDLGAHTLTTGGSDADTAYAGVIAGTGGLTKTGAGAFTLSGAHTYAGATTVDAGTLVLTGALASSVTTVNTGGSLTGTGSVAGTVTVNAGALANRAGDTLTVGALTLAPAAAVSVTLGAPSAPALFAVTNDLTLDGTLNVAISGGFAPGVYRIFTYGGTLTDNGLDLGALPAGVSAADLIVQTSVSGRVNLINTTGLVLTYWDGDDAARHDNLAVDGGDGVWSATSRNWTTANGLVTTDFRPATGVAVFQGAAGAVTVDAAGVDSAGMIFATSGYVLSGGPITLTGATGVSRLTVDDGSATGGLATVASALTGASTLEKAGAGTLVLTAENTYAAGTRVLAGTLQVGAGGAAGALGSGPVTVDAGATLAFARGDTVTFAGVVSGAGALRQTGPGTLVLTGDNTHTGGTTVAAGGLQVGDNTTTGSLGSGPVTVDAGATLTFFRSDDIAVSNAITGAGTVILRGGAVTLTGANTFTGGVSVAGGKLRIGDNTAAGSLGAGSVVNSGTLEFARSDSAYVYAGDISGTGELIQSGAGTTTLTGANTYAGTTTIAAGTLQIGDGGAAGTLGTAPVVNNGVLAFNRADAVTVTNAISGSGGFEQRGAGAVTLAGANTFTGDSFVRAGRLNLRAGSSVANLTVAAGATLGGDGLVRGNLINSGTVAPGFSPGTLNVAGDFTQNAAGVLAIELVSTAPGGFDRVIVTGAASLAGTIRVINSGYTAAVGDAFTVLEAAGGVTGSLTLDAPIYAAAGLQVRINPNDVTLVFAPPSPPVTGLTPNQTVLADTLATLVTSNPGNAFLNGVAATPAAQLPGVLNALSPQGYDRWWDNLRHDTVALVRSTESHLDAVSDTPGRALNLWAQVNRRESTFAKNDDERAGSADAGGVTVGADLAKAGDVTLGGLFSYGNDRIRSNLRTTVHHYTGALYGRYDLPERVLGLRFFADGSAGLGFADYASKRTVDLPGAPATASAKTDATDRFANARVGAAKELGDFKFTAYAGVQHTRHEVDGFDESGAGDASLSVNRWKAESLASRTGLMVELPVRFNGLVISPSLNVAWRHEFAEGSPDLSATLLGREFTVEGRGPARDGLEAGLGLNVGINEHLSVHGAINAYVDGNRGHSQSYNLGVNYKF